MNEMVIFSLKEAMKDGNNRVKTVDEKAASIRLNFALTEIAPVEDYTHRLNYLY